MLITFLSFDSFCKVFITFAPLFVAVKSRMRKSPKGEWPKGKIKPARGTGCKAKMVERQRWQ